MTLHTANPASAAARTGLENASLPGGIDCPSNAPKTAPAQANLLRNQRLERAAILTFPRPPADLG